MGAASSSSAVPAAKAVDVEERTRSDDGARRVRAPAVAGILYPADAFELRDLLNRLLASAPAPTRIPKALIVPHGGLRCSGGVAARAYAELAPGAESIRRVVVAGPAHRQTFDGLAVPECEAFATPLGAVPVDVAAVAELLALPSVRRTDGPHRREHAIEMQLPFLQRVLHGFEVVPLLVGRASPETIAEALRTVWGGRETLVVATSDLSREASPEDADCRDRRTVERILRGEPGLDHRCACGCELLDALLIVARERGLSSATLDRADSGETGGGGRVVGYGAFAFS
jgi:AmmeMemoRadiSam system protein B